MASRKVGLSGVNRARSLWFRNDLRLDDNPALQAACEGAESLLPVFVFDPVKFWKPTLAGAHKSSARRARFLLESVTCLRQQLESKGSGLVVALGTTSEVVPPLCGSNTDTFVTTGVCREETREEASVERQLKRNQSSLQRTWGGTLYMPDECGCDPAKLPLMFTSFKNKAESRGRIQNPTSAPNNLPPLPVPADGPAKQEFLEALKFLPTLEQLGFPPDEVESAKHDDKRGVMPFQGGEVAALKRLQSWMFDNDNLKDYFEVRNGMVGESYSSKLSPWFALGCISPRRVWQEAQRYEKQRVKNKSTYWLVFELTWRDFYIYMAFSQGDKLFKVGGVSGDKTPWTGSRDALEKWKTGRTGDKLVDANMRELAATGFQSNRGRQNTASYLIFDLGVDWRYGAAHFEEMLLDYDPCSNWGNWVAAAGLTGQRVNKFNTKKQLNDYDSKREYVNLWLQGNGGNGGNPSTDDKLEMSLDNVIKQGGSGGKGSGGKGKRGGQGYTPDNNDRKARRWQSRNSESYY